MRFINLSVSALIILVSSSKSYKVVSLTENDNHSWLIAALYQIMFKLNYQYYWLKIKYNIFKGILTKILYNFS